MIQLRPSHERGSANFGWLNSQHTFSFGSYYDSSQMGFSALRVINDDHVTPGAGFDTHGHRDMEIISYVLQGEIAHKDSEGNETRLPPGEFQLMSAGRGIRHSEYNPSSDQPLHFLQIWIQPNVTGEAPGYQQKAFGQASGLTLVASQDGALNSLVIKQDAKLYQLILPAGMDQTLSLDPARHYYIHVIEGELQVGTSHLQAGDGVKLAELGDLNVQASKMPVKALFFDLP